jgi:hypothetical protein
MRIIAGPWFCLGLFLLGFAPIPGQAFSEAAKGSGRSEQRVLAVLDPVDLHLMTADPDWGDFMRRSFAANPSWKVLARDSMMTKLQDYGVDTRVACHEFQCAFDAGNILSAEFVLFWSVTGLDELYAYTLNLVHVPTSQTVWSKVGDIRKRQLGSPSGALEASLAQLADWLGPDKVRTGRREKLGQLTVLDLSAAGSTPARAMAERVATHLYASRNYDIMGKKELDELLSALGINKAAFLPSDSSIYAIGGKMGISHLVYSRLLATRNGGLQLRLALYDIAARKLMRERLSQSTQDFRKLLQFEESFFSSLFRMPGSEAGGAPPQPKPRWTWAGAGTSLAFAAVCGYFSYAAAKDADREYARFQTQAGSRESAEGLRAKVQDKDRSSLVWGVMGGIGLAGAGGFLVFSF